MKYDFERPPGYNNWREVVMSYRRSEGARSVAKAVKLGILPPAKSQKCFDCGNPAFCYDHRDYRKPLWVQPVCKRCDGIRGPGDPYIGWETKEYYRLLKRAKERFYKVYEKRMAKSRSIIARNASLQRWYSDWPYCTKRRK